MGDKGTIQLPVQVPVPVPVPITDDDGHKASESVSVSEVILGSEELRTLQISPTMNGNDNGNSNSNGNDRGSGSGSGSTSGAVAAGAATAVGKSKSTSLTPPRIRIGGLSGIKEKPVCNVPALRKENMSAELLSSMCFKSEDVLMASACASACTTASGATSNADADGNGNGNDDTKIHNANVDVSVSVGHGVGNGVKDEESRTEEWALLKQSILHRTESRNGRDLQRFDTPTPIPTPTGPATNGSGGGNGNGNGNANANGNGNANGNSVEGQQHHQQQQQQQTTQIMQTPQSSQLCRLTTGSVPIMSDGRILLVSSSRKEEWILPKGGWELDESLEVSALRETYEEGGILGIVGPRLTGIEYETRKGKKRRLELEASLKKLNEGNNNNNNVNHGDGHGNGQGQGQGHGHVSTVVSTHSANSSTCPSEDGGECIHTITPTTSMVTAGTGGNNNRNGSSSPAVMITSATSNSNLNHNNNPNNNILLNNHSEHGQDNASLCSIASITSDGSAYCGHVRMYMFPMYVLEVREHWPESGRARKVVDIDTAIEMMASSSRPEFHKVLLEVKDRGYHLKPCVGKNFSGQSDLIPSSHVVI